MKRLWIAALVLVWLLPPACPVGRAAARESSKGVLSDVPLGQEQHPEIGIGEKLGNTVPLTTEFYDESGNFIPLSSIIDKPTIVVFVYYKCPGICTPLLTEVTHIIDKLDLELGKEYQVVSLSFDPDEKPELAREKKEAYLGELKKKVNPNGWRFLTGDAENIRTLTDAAGFYYKKDGVAWLHSGALIALSSSGKVTRYLYGIKHLPFDVKMAVYEATEGRTGPTIAKVMQFCFPYDPEGKRYAFDIVRVSGIFVLGFVVVFAVVFLRQSGNPSLWDKKGKAPIHRD
ncbi:MAG: SCO family protein [Ignavibacteriales bacterium]|nr:SCO family protein [Ignavibacteriales bacterium]